MPMEFTAGDFRGLVTALERRPEWRQELRHLIVPEEILTLPQVVHDLVEAHWRAEERLSRLEAVVAELAEAQRRAEKRLAAEEEWRARAEERLSRLEAVVAELADRVSRLEAVVAELVEAHRRAEERLSRLEDRVSRLEAVVAELAERVSRLEAVVAELADRVSRLEAVVAELVEAHRRAEERLSRLEAVVAELAEAQRRTEERVSRLETRVDRLEKLLGVTVEEEAADVLRVVMEDKGYRARREAIYYRPDGEVDVILPVEDPEGRLIHVVLEAKVRLGWRAVEDWANRMRSKDFRARLAEEGFTAPYLVYVYGMRADTSAEHAARTFRIGLLTPRGEQIPPEEMIVE